MDTTNVQEVYDREVVTTRVVDAPRHTVWRLWTKAEHLTHWWGPRGFTNTFETFDLTPGGAWRYVMHGPDGTDFRNESAFVALIPLERIVIDHRSGPQFRLTVTFDDFDGKTKITFRQLFETAAECTMVKTYCIPGNEQTFDRLASHLTEVHAP